MSNRKQVSIYRGAEPNYNFEAFKYFILYLNKIQNVYEFYFPDTMGFPFSSKSISEDDISEFSKEHLPEIKRNEYYTIFILTQVIEGNFFSVHNTNAAFITINQWDKYFAPPSLFEYLLDSILSSLTLKESDFEIGFNKKTYGSIFDYKRNKLDAKTCVTLGYLSDKDKSDIEKYISSEYIVFLESLINKDWIGNRDEFGTVAHNLKSNFNYDIRKESGFNKSYFRKAFDRLIDIPLEITKFIIQTIFAVVLIYLLIVLNLNDNKKEDLEIKESLKKINSEIQQIKINQDEYQEFQKSLQETIEDLKRDSL